MKIPTKPLASLRESKIANIKSQKASNFSDEEDISSIDDISSWLESIKSSASPAMVQVLQSQIQVLGTVESPTLNGMMVDNMVTFLQKSLKKATENEKPIIRETYCQMIQNFVFMTEAKLRYAIDSTNKEARQLLEEAGQMMTDTVKTIANVVQPEMSLAGIAKNIDTTDSFKNGFFVRVGKLIGNKKMIAEKKQEFHTILSDLFVTLDKYQPLFGTSIVINGMLARYKKTMVDHFAEEQMEPIQSKRSIISLQQLAQMGDELTDALTDAANTGGMLSFSKIGTAVSKAAINNSVIRRAGKFDIYSIISKLKYYQEEIAGQKNQVAEEEQILKGFKQEKKAVGAFQFSQKKEIRAKLEEQELQIEQRKNALQKAEQKLQQMKDLFPEAHSIMEKVNKYEKQLTDIEQKYAVQL